MSKINHPNLVPAYAVIIINNIAYIVMPLMLYSDLATILEFKYSQGIHDESAITTIIKCCLEAIICWNNRTNKKRNWNNNDERI